MVDLVSSLLTLSKVTLPYHERNWSKTCVSTLVCLRLWLDEAASTEAVAAAAEVFDLVVVAAAAAAAASAAACRLEELSHLSRRLRSRRMCAAANVVYNTSSSHISVYNILVL